MKKPSSPLSELDHDCESGYVSGVPSEASIPDIHLTKPHVAFLNRQLQNLEPQGMFHSIRAITGLLTMLQEILQWCIITLPSLYQETAFGLTGLTTLDMLSKMNIPRPSMVNLIFFDTLHHFPETHHLVDRIRNHYPLVDLHISRPAGADTAEEFAKQHGERLWESDDELYDWIAKVEPAQRAYRELGVNAILTGRRRSQGGKRGEIAVIEVDDAGMIKVNPFVNWTFQQVEDYVKANNVPYNSLLDRGYKSVGDWHSTKPVKEGEDERSGRWQGQEKTECGIHNPRSNFAKYLREQELKKQREVMEHALKSDVPVDS